MANAFDFENEEDNTPIRSTKKKPNQGKKPTFMLAMDNRTAIIVGISVVLCASGFFLATSSAPIAKIFRHLFTPTEVREKTELPSPQGIPGPNPGESEHDWLKRVSKENKAGAHPNDQFGGWAAQRALEAEQNAKTQRR